MWNTFNIKNLGDYHNLHVQTGTFLLTGIFETFIETRRNIYELDPAHFSSVPNLAWISALK